MIISVSFSLTASFLPITIVFLLILLFLQAFQNLTVFSEQFEGGCNAIDSKSLPGVGCLDHAVGGITG